MDYKPTKAEIKEFTCYTCKKECDEICTFSEYGTEARKAESLKNRGYCEPCFDEKAKKLDS